MVSLSCQALALLGNLWLGLEDASQREDYSPVLGMLAQKGWPARLSQLGAGWQDLPPWSRGLRLPTKAAAESCSCLHLPPHWYVLLSS